VKRISINFLGRYLPTWISMFVPIIGKKLFLTIYVDNKGMPSHVEESSFIFQGNSFKRIRALWILIVLWILAPSCQKILTIWECLWRIAKYARHCEILFKLWNFVEELRPVFCNCVSVEPAELVKISFEK